MTLVPPAGAHGGDGARIARALGLELTDVLDLSQSLNPVAPDPRRVLERHLDALGRYPDDTLATAALAEAMGVDVARLLLTNGGSEAISLVASEIGGFVHEPEFALHPRGEGPLWRSNPHNPSGLLAEADEHAGAWDEAFYPLATGKWTRGDEASVVVGSLTKLLACPGLRVGYVLADPSLIARCRARQPAWSLNALACESLGDLLAPLELARDARLVAELREELRALLERHGLAVWPSQANWVLVEQPRLRDALAHEGVVVRDCASFALPGVARIAVPDARGLERLDGALTSCLARLESAREHPIHQKKRSDQ